MYNKLLVVNFIRHLLCVVQDLKNEGQALLGNLTAVSNILSTFRSDLVSCLLFTH